ncbi:MAG TPA: efflux RND transporter periplasmic adaptor subunit [Gemmatirosa sp.]
MTVPRFIRRAPRGFLALLVGPAIATTLATACSRRDAATVKEGAPAEAPTAADAKAADAKTSDGKGDAKGDATAPDAKTADAGDAGASDAGGDEAGPSHAVVAAQTAVARAMPFAEHVPALGTVVARPGHVAALSAPGPARVARVLVVPGQRVAAGTVLVTLDAAPFAAAEQSASAGLVNAERARDRAARLVGEGISPRRDLDQATADLAVAQASAATARRTRALATLRSPIGGVVTRLAAVLGAAVDASAPLVEVADPSAVDVILTVTPSAAARVRPGAAVELRAGQGDATEPLGTGRVADVAATVDTTSRGVSVRVLPSGASRALRIGETVNGDIVVGTRRAAVVIPPAALVPDGEGYRVFVVGDSGVVHSRSITVGGRADSVVEVTGGLRAGERVATAGAFGLEDGARIAGLAPAPRPASAGASAAKAP